MKRVFQFIIAVLISFIPGFIGMSVSPTGASDIWYNELVKSMLTPDGWVFATVWPILYLLLGIALFLIIIDKSRQYKVKAYWLFIAQMALNAFWSYLFFGIHMTGLALIELVALFGVSLWMARVFYQIRHSASYLVWPYLVWLVFAMFLNGVVIFLN